MEDKQCTMGLDEVVHYKPPHPDLLYFWGSKTEQGCHGQGKMSGK